MTRLEHSANIQNGKLHLVDPDGFVNDIANTFDDGIVVDVIVQRKERRRSIQQNKYLWAVPYAIIAEHTGYTPEEVNEWVKGEFLSEKQVEIGGKVHENHASTKNLSTTEFEALTEKLRRWAAEFLNCTIPEPNQTDWTE